MTSEQKTTSNEPLEDEPLTSVIAEDEKVCSLPLPPACYVSQYTNENVSSGAAPKPPPPPGNAESFSTFGKIFSQEDVYVVPLAEQGIKNLIPKVSDRRSELKKLNHSVLVSFLDLLEIMILSPESKLRPEKTDDITLLFVHMHHLINEYRPHQARETIRALMHAQKREAQRTCSMFQTYIQLAAQVLSQVATHLDKDNCDTTLLDSIDRILSHNGFQTSQSPTESDAVHEVQDNSQVSVLTRDDCEAVVHDSFEYLVLPPTPAVTEEFTHEIEDKLMCEIVDAIEWNCTLNDVENNS